MRLLVTFLVGIAIGAAGMWFVGANLGFSGRDAPHTLTSASDYSVSGKYRCMEGAMTYELKSDGTFYVTFLNTTSGTYKIDGDRINFTLQNGPSQVFSFKNGMLSIDGSGHDCVKL